jgi:hypothetical protein
MTASSELSTQAIAAPARAVPSPATIRVYHSQLGWVRGTPAALASLASPLTPRGAAPEQLVEACRAAIQTAAAPYGAEAVQAVSAGPARRRPGAGLEAPIEIRVLYRAPDAYEVRQAVVTCRTDARGNVVEASA